MAEAKVTLGGTEYVLKPLTIGQLKALMPDFLAASKAALLGQEGAMDGFNSALAILEASFKRSHPDIVVDDLEATPQEIVNSITEIGRASGMIQTGEVRRAGAVHH